MPTTSFTETEISFAFPGVDVFRSENLYGNCTSITLSPETKIAIESGQQVQEIPTNTTTSTGICTNRLAIGSLIPATHRKVYPVDPDGKRNQELSGSIGFADISQEEERVPFPPENFKNGLPFNWEKKTCLVVNTFGIEPEYQRQGLGDILLNLLEQIATVKGLKVIVFRDVVHESSQRLVTKHGYVNYQGWERAIKALP